MLMRDISLAVAGAEFARMQRREAEREFEAVSLIKQTPYLMKIYEADPSRLHIKTKPLPPKGSSSKRRPSSRNPHAPTGSRSTPRALHKSHLSIAQAQYNTRRDLIRGYGERRAPSEYLRLLAHANSQDDFCRNTLGSVCRKQQECRNIENNVDCLLRTAGACLSMPTWEPWSAVKRRKTSLETHDAYSTPLALDVHRQLVPHVQS